MHYIDESTPWTPAEFRKYQLYLALRKQRDKFLKNMQEISHLDWRIDRRLVEAGGLGKTVYYLPARGSCRTDWKLLHELAEGGRDVQVVTVRKYDYPKLTAKDVDKIRESILEFKLYSELINPWREPFYQEMFKDYQLQEPYEFDPCWTMDPNGQLRIREISIIRRRANYVPR